MKYASTRPVPVPETVTENPAFGPLLALLRDYFITPAELGERWRYSQAHLANLRRRGAGPPWTQPAGRILYRLSDVIAAELATSTGAISLDRVLLVVAGCGHLTDDQRAKTIATLSIAFGGAAPVEMPPASQERAGRPRRKRGG